MPFAIQSSKPIKPKKVPKKLSKNEDEDDDDDNSQPQTKPLPKPLKKKLGELSISCDDEFNEDNN